MVHVRACLHGFLFSVSKVDFTLKCLKTVMQPKGYIDIYIFFFSEGILTLIVKHSLQLRVREFLLDTSYSVTPSTFLVPRMCRSLN